MTFNYRRDIPDGQANDQFLVQVSSNGTTFTQIGQIGATGDGSFVDPAYQTFTFDLTPYISANTTIRFSVGNSVDNGDIVYVDNVQFTYTTVAAPATAVAVTYTENGTPVPIGALSQITDADDANMTSATVTLTNHQANDFLAVTGTLPAGITASSYNAVTGILTLTGPATKAAYQTALSQIVFSNSSENPDTSDRLINVNVTDAHGNVSIPATATVHVVALDDAPVILAPNSLLYASSGNVEPIDRVSFADVDTNGSVTVTFSTNVSGDGHFAATSGSGVSVVSGSGTDTLIMTGTIADIDAFLAANKLTYDTLSSDQDIITVSINDGAGATASKTITVNDVNPSFTAGGDTKNFAGDNINGQTLDGLTGADTVYTTWNHVGSTPTIYQDSGSSGGSDNSDTIYAIFTPAQLNEILTNSTALSNLQNFLSNPKTNGLDLSFTTWNAEVAAHTTGNTGFETSHIELANLWSTDNSTSAGGTPTSNYINIDTTWNSVLGQTPTATSTSGSDLMIASAAGTVSGGNGSDVLVAAPAGNTLDGGPGNDFLLGGVGNDVLIGGTGNDVLAGGAGADTFKFAELGSANSDIVVDYNFTEGDRIDLSGLLDATGINDGNMSSYLHLLEVGSNIVVQVDTTGSGNFTGGTHDVATLVGIATAGNTDPVHVYFSGHVHGLIS